MTYFVKPCETLWEICNSHETMKLIIKVCGMREADNIRDLQALEVDWMGMIFFKKSARHVDSKLDISIETPKVGVFVNETLDVILDKVEQFQLSKLQLHGDESPAFCAALKKQFAGDLIKVFSVGDDFDFEQLAPYESIVDYFLFDTKGKQRGGNGVTFDWQILQAYKGQLPFLLSGGIGEEHMAEIKNFRHSKMIGIDLNSKFEISPAYKDIQKLKNFIYGIRS
jgi:phosphoribosylanthranilate isomerase